MENWECEASPSSLMALLLLAKSRQANNIGEEGRRNCVLLYVMFCVDECFDGIEIVMRPQLVPNAEVEDQPKC